MDKLKTELEILKEIAANKKSNDIKIIVVQMAGEKHIILDGKKMTIEDFDAMYPDSKNSKNIIIFKVYE